MNRRSYIEAISNSNERIMLVTVTVVVLILSLVSSSFATVKPYVFDNSRNHEMALEDLVTLSQEPPEPSEEVVFAIEQAGLLSTQQDEDSLTQAILVRADAEYQKGLKNGEQSAMNRMLTYLKDSGVTNDLAEILIDDITDGAYQAKDNVVQGLRIIAAK